MREEEHFCYSSPASGGGGGANAHQRLREPKNQGTSGVTKTETNQS